MSVLTMRGITVRYPSRRPRPPALDDVTLAIEPGEIVGVIGPNGAGKTTLLRVLTGDARPTHGLALVAGLPSHRRAVRRRLGWVPEPPVLPRELTGTEWLSYLASWRARSAAQRAALVRWAVELGQLDGFVARRIETCSRGMVQRLALAGAAICGSAALLLDEALGGIDPVVRQHLRIGLSDLAREGRALLVASHDLGTVERLASRVLVLGGGRIVADVRTHQLLSERVMELALDGGALQAAPALCVRFPGAVRTGEGVAVPLTHGLTPEQVLAACRAQRVAVAATRVRYRALDDLLAAPAP